MIGRRGEALTNSVVNISNEERDEEEGDIKVYLSNTMCDSSLK